MLNMRLCLNFVPPRRRVTDLIIVTFEKTREFFVVALFLKQSIHTRLLLTNMDYFCIKRTKLLFNQRRNCVIKVYADERKRNFVINSCYALFVNSILIESV